MIPTGKDLKREEHFTDRFNLWRFRAFSKHADFDVEACPHCLQELGTLRGMTHWCDTCGWWAGRPWFRVEGLECQRCGNEYNGKAFTPDQRTGHCEPCISGFEYNVRRKYSHTKPTPDAKRVDDPNPAPF